MLFCFSLTDEVAVIDEIQLLRDPMRGWAWTRALLGIVADEVHVCGEEGAVDLVRSIMSTTDENVEVWLMSFICLRCCNIRFYWIIYLQVFKYNRLTDLHVENHAVRNLDNIQDGDCIVCFSKNDVYSVSEAKIKILGSIRSIFTTSLLYFFRWAQELKVEEKKFQLFMGHCHPVQN